MSSKRRMVQNNRKVSVSTSENTTQPDTALDVALDDVEDDSEQEDTALLDRLMNAQRCPKRLRDMLNEYANTYTDRPILAAVLYCDRLMSDISQDVVNAFFSKDTSGLKRMSGDMSYLASQLRILSLAMTSENLSNSKVQADSNKHVLEKNVAAGIDISDDGSNSDVNDM